MMARTNDLEAAQQFVEVLEIEWIAEIAGQADELMQQREDVRQVLFEHHAIVACRHTQYVVEALSDGQMFHVLFFFVHI